MHVSMKLTHCHPLRIPDAPIMTNFMQGDGIGWQQTQDDLCNLLSIDDSLMLGLFCGNDDQNNSKCDDDRIDLLSMAGLSTFHSDPSSSVSTSGNVDDYGWLSYVATAPHARRKGYASTLVSKLLKSSLLSSSSSSINKLPEINHKQLPVGLFASSLGAPLYERNGFVSSGAGAQLVQYEYFDGSVGIDNGCKTRHPANPANKGSTTSTSIVNSEDFITLVPASQVVSKVISLDAKVYGVSREKIIRHWASVTAATNPETITAKTDTVTTPKNMIKGTSEKALSLAAAGNWVLMENNEAQGFILGRPLYHPDHVSSGVFLGPIIARSDEEASLLLQTALSSMFRCGVTLVQSLTLLSGKENVEGGALRWCTNTVAVAGKAAEVTFMKLGEPSNLMVRGQSLPWLDRMRQLTHKKEEYKESFLRPYAAFGYEYG